MTHFSLGLCVPSCSLRGRAVWSPRPLPALASISAESGGEEGINYSPFSLSFLHCAKMLYTLLTPGSVRSQKSQRKHREVEWLFQNHTARIEHSWDVDPGSLVWERVILNHRLWQAEQGLLKMSTSEIPATGEHVTWRERDFQLIKLIELIKESWDWGGLPGLSRRAQCNHKDLYKKEAEGNLTTEKEARVM